MGHFSPLVQPACLLRRGEGLLLMFTSSGLTDVALLSEGLHQWPRDITGYHGISRDHTGSYGTACAFFGRRPARSWVRIASTTSSFTFQVPSSIAFGKLCPRRKRTTCPQMPTGHLHWLSLCPALADLGRSRQILADHVWLEYNSTYPANTSKTANPRYRITGPAPRCQIQSPCCPSPRCQVTP